MRKILTFVYRDYS